jgi:hypothetical protein
MPRGNFVPIRTLCQETGFHESTIRKLIRTRGIEFQRNSPRGKILVDRLSFEKYLQATTHRVQKDQFVLDILKEFREAVR